MAQSHMVGTAPPLLEREEALAALTEALASALGGEGRVALVYGEAGIGKTTVVRAFARASRGTARVLWGACDPLFTPRPFGPLYDLAREAGSTVLLEVEREDDRTAQLASLLDLLGETPTVGVVEDAHWADEASLDALRYLARRIERVPCLLVVTYRDDEVGAEHPLRLLLGAIPSGVARRIELGPLSDRAVRELASAAGRDATGLYERTRGNPFYVTEVLAASGSGLPATVRDAVLARALGLGNEARAVLDLASVVPGQVERWLLDEVLGSASAGANVCVERGMLVPGPGGLAFRHELARQAILEALGPERRAANHRAVLHTLEARPDRDSLLPRLAHHAEAAGDAGAVVRYAPLAAARAAAVGSHREAAALYELALRYADEAGDDVRVALVEAYAHVAHLTGRLDEAIAARREAIELSRRLGDPLREGENLARLTMPFIGAGRNAEAEEAGRQAIAVLEELPPGRELAVAYAFQAYLRMLSRDNADGVAWGERARSLAEEVGDVDTLAMALNMIGTSHVMAGEIEPGCEYLERSLALALEHGLTPRVASAYGMLASGLGEMYEFDRAERWIREYLRFGGERDLDVSYITSWLAAVHVYRGRWDEGAELAQQLLAGDAGPLARITALVALGRVRARRGDPGAEEALDEALELSRPGGHLQRLGHVLAARAEAAWLAGDRERALAEARAAYPLALEKRHLWFAGELAYWQWRCGRLESAPGWIAEPYRLQLAGDALGAARAWATRGCPYERARALAESENTEARLEAVGALDELGAAPLARQLRGHLRALRVRVPRGPRPSTRDNAAGLTRRELEVLALVAEGLRNAEIADWLVVSRRTVDHHVSAILRKLGAHTRGEAAAEAARLGLLENR
ncbi:MAG TPA: AAA family ATPase [Gaiellaceae bacterium]|nr:AAA family ATPase [Gaiellaceae bacterium]